MALTFASASSQYLSLASGIVTAGPIAVPFWYRPVAANVDQTMFRVKQGSSVNLFGASIEGAETRQNWQARTSGGNNVVVQGATAGVAAGSWNHFFGYSATSTNHGQFLNGSGQVTDTTDSDPKSLDATGIGGTETGGGLFNGQLAELAIWNISVAGQEAAWAKALGAGCLSPLFFRRGLVAYLPMIRDTRDLCGTSWTVNGGAPAVFDHPRIIYPDSGRSRRFAAAAGGGGSVFNPYYFRLLGAA